MNREIVQTKDGSTTLYVPGLDEHYHSVHGALQESLHVFIHAGFLHQAAVKKQLNVLEVGFGTGLNAVLTLLYAEKEAVKTRYTSLEKYPITTEELALLKYDVVVKGNNEYLQKLHQVAWEEWVEINPLFSLLKLQTDLKSFSSAPQFDLIYFDAFAPSAQADLWTIAVFERMYQCLKPGGILVTYCVKGEVRRNMKAAGFEVEKIPGPPGKREMARATKPEQS